MFFVNHKTKTPPPPRGGPPPPSEPVPLPKTPTLTPSAHPRAAAAPLAPA